MTSRILMALGLALAVCLCPAAAQSDDAVTASGRYKFQLRDGKEFTGFMTEKTTIDLLVAGLELKVPVPLVETIRFDNNDVTRIRMQLNNGDSLSGQIMPSQLGVIADWGTLKINSQSLAQVTRVNEPAPKATVAADRTTDQVPVVPASPAETENEG